MRPAVFLVRFGTVASSPLFGHFRSEARARWWAEAECDGQAYTIHKVER